MKKTLQDQYLSIKEGKGHKGVFLTEAKRQFPNIVRNAATFDEAVASLKTKNIILENVLMVMPAVMDRPKKESYETAFEEFLAEAKKKKDEDENVKAEEKKVSKPVEKDLEKNFDNSDEKNPDNMIFDQIMMGYYAEMKDPKNADKTIQELKDIVFKNLSKDPIYYTKDGQFGIKDLGYVTEHPGLGEPKEAKGKYKSSGYGDLKESKLRKVIREMIDEEIDEAVYLDPQPNPLKDLTKMLISAGINAELRGLNYDFIRVDDDKYEISLQNGMHRVRDLSKAGSPIVGEYSTPQEVVNYFTKSSNSSFPKEYRPFHIDRSLEETTLRKAIREMIDAELEEIRGGGNYGMMTINTHTGGGERNLKMAYAPDVLDFRNEARLKRSGDLIWDDSQNKLFVSQRLFNNLAKLSPGNPTLQGIVRDAFQEKGKNKNKIRNIIKDLYPIFSQKNGTLSNPNPDVENSGTFISPISFSVERAPSDSEKGYYKAGELLFFPYVKKGKKNKDQSVEEGVLGVRDIDVSPGYPVDLPISYSDDKNVAHYSSDDRYSSQEDLLDPEDYFENIKDLSYGDAFNYLEELGLEIDEIETILNSLSKSSLRESVEKDLMDINKEAEHEVLQSKLDKIDALIDLRRSKLGKLDEDEDMKALTDKKKVKELEKDIKKLEVARNKVEKMMSKFKGKKKEDKEVIDEDEPIDENLDVDLEYIEDSTERLDAGQKVDSIRDTYDNLGIDQKSDLTDYLNTIAPDDLKSDYVY